MLPSIEREVLYLFKANGCEHCAAAIPEFDRFAAKHPAFLALTLDAGGPFPEALGIKIRATPTYVYRRGTASAKAEGVLKASDLEKWLKKLGATP